MNFTEIKKARDNIIKESLFLLRLGKELKLSCEPLEMIDHGLKVSTNEVSTYMHGSVEYFTDAILLDENIKFIWKNREYTKGSILGVKGRYGSEKKG